MARIVSIIGTRPEIIKMAPVIRELDRIGHEHILVHSGQHYDLMMDGIFFKELELRSPDEQIEIGGLPPHKQIAATMDQLGDVVSKADMVVVQGDTNTTLSGAMLANKLGKTLGHVEAGMRSFDRNMPEEHNRVLADHLSDILFAPSKLSIVNLENEGLRKGVHLTGNTGVDAALQHIKIAHERSRILQGLRLKPDSFFLVTFHRTENADNPKKLRNVLVALSSIATKHGKEVVFPIHPRTRRRVKEFGLEGLLAGEGIRVIDPIGYFDTLILEETSSLILTDSGGLQEEACTLHIPCVTLRENTERPETLDIGCNVLAGTDIKRIEKATAKQLRFSGKWKNPYGDGTAGKKIAAIVKKFYDKRGAS